MVWVPPNLLSVRQKQLELLCFDAGGRFLKHQRNSSVKFGITYVVWRIIGLINMNRVPITHQALSETRKPVRSQFAGRDRQRQEMIQEYALGATETWGGVALPAGGGEARQSFLEEAKQLQLVPLIPTAKVAFLRQARKKRKSFHFQSLFCFSFTRPLGFNKMAKEKGSWGPPSDNPGVNTD